MRNRNGMQPKKHNTYCIPNHIFYIIINRMQQLGNANFQIPPTIYLHYSLLKVKNAYILLTLL